MAAAFSASKVSVKGQMRTLVPGSNTAVCAARDLLVAHHATIEPHVLQHAACRRSSRTTACCRETSGLCSTTVLAGSRPMVTSAASTSTSERRLSLILLNQTFTGQWAVCSWQLAVCCLAAALVPRVGLARTVRHSTFCGRGCGRKVNGR